MTMEALQRILGTKTPVVGMIHFGPLLGYTKAYDAQQVLDSALADLQALVDGGADAIMVENNYDTPHHIFVGPETVACMTYLTSEIRKHTTLPLGISVLWNDYRAALAIAKVCNATFVRVPVFVDTVRTNYGEVTGNPEEVLACRSLMDAEDVLLFTDVHVKHAELLSHTTLHEAAAEAKRQGSDGIIITGKWTGDAPNLDDLREAREAVGDFPILVGSGATAENVQSLRKYVDGVIVSTSIKSGEVVASEINLKRPAQRVDVQKVRAFMQAFNA